MDKKLFHELLDNAANSPSMRRYQNSFRFSKHINDFTKREAKTYWKFKKQIKFMEHVLEICKDKIKQPFVESCYEQIRRRGKLSDKQCEALDRFQKKWSKLKLWQNEKRVTALSEQQNELEAKMQKLQLADMNVYDQEFFLSLAQQYESYGRLSEKQINFVDKWLEKYHKSIMVNLFT